MKKYDYLIVGSGLFGAIFAYEMNKKGKLKEGDTLIFSTFGSGFTSGACIIKW